MNIVIDTNVVISGTFFGGAPRRVLEAVVDKTLSAYATAEIVEEYTEFVDARLGEVLGAIGFNVDTECFHVHRPSKGGGGRREQLPPPLRDTHLRDFIRAWWYSRSRLSLSRSRFSRLRSLTALWIMPMKSATLTQTHTERRMVTMMFALAPLRYADDGRAAHPPANPFCLQLPR